VPVIFCGFTMPLNATAASAASIALTGLRHFFHRQRGVPMRRHSHAAPGDGTNSRMKIFGN
jgi:hypothetical protein